MITTRCPLLGLTLLLGCGSAVAAAPVATVMPDDIALTVYSSALPGAIPPEFYRPLPGVPVPTASSLPEGLKTASRHHGNRPALHFRITMPSRNLRQRPVIPRSNKSHE